MTEQTPPTDPCKPTTPPAPCDNNTPPPPCDDKKCCAFPAPQKAPEVPKRKDCPQPCNCPPLPGTPTDCLDELIKKQAKLVKQGDRAKTFVDELTEIQGKVASAQADYTQARYKDLLKMWWEQDKLIADLGQKLICGVPCWECLLECRLCPQLTEIRKLEDELNGTGSLTTQVFSLIDLQFWHQRNVTQMQERVHRIERVLSAWEKPSDTLGDVLDKNGKLIDDTQKIIATDSAKAVYDFFMTLVPKHWAIRPRGVKPKPEKASPSPEKTSDIPEKFITICKCDDGKPDVCCGPDVGIQSLRDRLLGPLPYLVDPAEVSRIICCIATERLGPASDQLATAQADLAAKTDLIAQVTKLIADKTASIEATFKAELGNPIDCSKYTKKDPPPSTPPVPNVGDQGAARQPDQQAS
jgi:hypothetical protein